MIQGVQIDAAIDDAGGEQRLDLRSEKQPIARFDVMQRLDARAVAREQQRLFVPVPERDGEHAAQPFERGRTPFLVGVNDRLGVARRVENVARRFQPLPQLAIVVDLTVEDEPDRSVFVVNRLMAGRQVDDAQAAHAESGAGLHVHALIVRSAMANDVAHRANEPGIPIPRRARRGAVCEACNTAHGQFASCTTVATGILMSWVGESRSTTGRPAASSTLRPFTSTDFPQPAVVLDQARGARVGRQRVAPPDAGGRRIGRRGEGVALGRREQRDVGASCRYPEARAQPAVVAGVGHREALDRPRDSPPAYTHVRSTSGTTPLTDDRSV